MWGQYFSRRQWRDPMCFITPFRCRTGQAFFVFLRHSKEFNHESRSIQSSDPGRIPGDLPANKTYDPSLNHAPKRRDILSPEEKKLAIRNALRYIPVEHHSAVIREFADELEQFGRIYMYRYKPDYPISARSLEAYPHRSVQAAAIMLMLSNNLDHAVAQHPDELITYGGNGAVFQNWAQYRLTMKYLATMSDEQTLVLYSGHPAL